MQVTRQTRVGSPVDRMVPPRDVDGATHFVSRDGCDLREFLYADLEQAYQAQDLAMLAKHLMNRPLDQDYDSIDRLFYIVMGDGRLATLTVYRAEKVTAWTVQETDGTFLSVAVVDGTVYVLVERGGGVTVERFDDSVFLDAALDGTRDTPTAIWSGLDHLEGRTVRALADGGAQADLVVSGGRITLAEAAARIQVGLPYTHEIVPLPPVVGSGSASSAGGTMRLVRADFRLLDTKALWIDTGAGARPLPFRRFGRDTFDSEPPAFSGDVRVRALGWRRSPLDPLWQIRQDAPLPCTVLSVTTEIKLAD
jgi:hypothetical protein